VRLPARRGWAHGAAFAGCDPLPAMRARPAFLLVLLALPGCGGAAAPYPRPDHRPHPDAPRFGPAPRWRPAPLSRAVTARRPVRGLRCGPGAGPWFGAHIEMFVSGLDVVIPAGIGVAPPHRRDGAYVRGGACSYPVRTTEPTGVIEVRPGERRTLGDLFALWGEPLSRRRLMSFSGGPVRAFVNGRRWRSDPRAIPLTRHVSIVLELGPHVTSRSVYLFPPGL
jgi:hypothetical protein